jgi:hypothetical protein
LACKTDILAMLGILENMVSYGSFAASLQLDRNFLSASFGTLFQTKATMMTASISRICKGRHTVRATLVYSMA